MLNTLKDFIVEHWIWPLLTAVSGGIISRLWIGYKFRWLAKNERQELSLLQDAYNCLCWNAALPAGHKKAEPLIPKLGQFHWEEIRKPLQRTKWLFGNKDRSAIRFFLTMEDFFDKQPNYLELSEEQAAREFKRYLMRHIWCLNFLVNIGTLGTNKTTLGRKTYYNSLPILFNIQIDRVKAFDNYAASNGVTIISGVEAETLIKVIAEQVYRD